MRALLLTLLLTLPLSADRIAILGDSISTGAHAADRPHNGYPARLGHLFEGRHEVRAFAKSSHCLLRKADHPLAATPLFQAALDWKPDVALIMLGTNDSSDQRPNWKHHADLEADARFFLGSLRQANPEVTVHFLGPPPMFPDKPGLEPDRMPDLEVRSKNLITIRDTYRRIAAAEPRTYHHDLTRTLTVDRVTDGVHPDTFGHQDIAYHLHELLCTGFDESHDLPTALAAAGIAPKPSDFHGCRRFDFPLPGDGAACTVVAPTQAAAGHPWIWRARFFGHQPALDLALLDRGYHLAYCDVANLYGAPAALGRWDAFHALATGKLGLAEKPILEGMSRGGLPIFLWASRNPGKVRAVYGDNPVCDFRSWPGGKPGKGSPPDWQRCLAAYRITEAQAATHPQPLDPQTLRPLAAAEIPVALVLGTADDVVPPAANGDLLAANYRRLGGPVTVWHKPGDGHHPHGLHPPHPLRRLLTGATPPTTIPAPSSEFRAADQGWPQGLWRLAFADLKRVAAGHPDTEIVFLGDSITQGLTGHADRLAHPGGKRPVDLHFGGRRTLSLGLSGDRTEHLLWRIGHGQFDGLSPRWVVVMIGVNNISDLHHTGHETALGTAAVVAQLRKSLPGTRLLLLGSLPAGRSPDDPRRTAIDILHREIAPLADDRSVFYQDLRPLFLNPDGTPNANMRDDAIHISPAGQHAWLTAIKPLLNQ